MRMEKSKKEMISYKMSRVCATNTRIEERMASALRKQNLLGHRRNLRGVQGTPDFCWKGKKIAIFCDSSFWHGYNWRKAKLQIKVRKKFWFKKIEDNIKRDQRVSKNLIKEGWSVLRFWDFEIERNPQKCAQRVLSVLDRTKNKVKA